MDDSDAHGVNGAAPRSTTNELSEEELQVIESRSAAATPAPWVSHVEGRDHTSGDSFIETPTQDLYVSAHDYRGGRGHLAADLDFIAHARQDIPRLIEEVRRLRSASRQTLR
jgi:predicted amidohydrolase